eukprot:7676004-Ditylum_brightwellii.AAC.1
MMTSKKKSENAEKKHWKQNEDFKQKSTLDGQCNVNAPCLAYAHHSLALSQKWEMSIPASMLSPK